MLLPEVQQPHVISNALTGDFPSWRIGETQDGASADPRKPPIRGESNICGCAPRRAAVLELRDNHESQHEGQRRLFELTAGSLNDFFFPL